MSINTIAHQGLVMSSTNSSCHRASALYDTEAVVVARCGSAASSRLPCISEASETSKTFSDYIHVIHG